MTTRADRIARRLWSRLRLPGDAGIVLADARFHSEVFCRLYLEGCDELLLKNPAAGLVAARVAPPLVLKLAPSASRNDLEVRALTQMGEAYRKSGNFFEAASVFPLALDLAERENLSPEVLGDLLRRYAALLIDQGRWAEAETHIRRAIDVFEPLPAGPGEFALGAAILQRGELRLRQERFAEAIDDFGMALGCLDPKNHPRGYFTAARQLVAALELAPELPNVNRATRWLRHARELQKGQRASLARFKLYCIEAEVLAMVGSTRRAQKHLQIARKGFERVGALHELALVSLQMAILLHGEGRFEELRQLTDDTLLLCRQRGLSPEALALLGPWQRAVQQNPENLPLLEGIRQELRQQAAREGRPI